MMLKRISLAMCLCLIAASLVQAQQTATQANASSAAEKEIRAAADSLVDSFNKRDAAAIAAHWTADGVYVNEDGQRFAGRQAIQSEYEALFQNSPEELEMKLEIDAIRMITPQIAIEEGRVALLPQPPGENRVMSRYTAVHVKQDGRWLMTDVRDTLVELPPNTGQLQDLDWLVGTWVADSIEAQVEWKCRWIENREFLAHYDYGNNVTYQDNSVYMDGQEMGTADEYYQQAQTLATTGGQAQTTDDEQWMPLGVFAMTNEDHTKANPILQLAANKDGIIRGNYTATLADHTLPVQGSVDKQTQRAAWTIGDKTENVFETGVYNLTKDEAPMLVHYGKDKTENWLLVRLDNDQQQNGQQPAR